MGAEPDIAAFTEASEGLGAWLLLAELDHRVRNELAAAAAALRLARHRRQAAAQPSELIDAAIERLENFCQVQHLLERHHNHGPLGQRLEALCRAIAKSKGAPQGVQIVVGSDDVMTDDETAWTVCAVACELMTNAFRHAFHGASRCALAVSLRGAGLVAAHGRRQRHWLCAAGHPSDTVQSRAGFGDRDRACRAPGRRCDTEERARLDRRDPQASRQCARVRSRDVFQRHGRRGGLCCSARACPRNSGCSPGRRRRHLNTRFAGSGEERT
jgi:two-component sensor histidine kinase